MNKRAIQMPLTLKYRKDGAWFVGQLVELPEVISQGATLEELEENIRDAYELVLSEQRHAHQPSRTSKSRRQVCVPA